MLRRETIVSLDIKVRRDSVYHNGRIIARYDINTLEGGIPSRETISVFARSGLRIATAFLHMDESTCRILTEKDQHEHFIRIDSVGGTTRIRQVIEFLLKQAYLSN